MFQAWSNPMFQTGGSWGSRLRLKAEQGGGAQREGPRSWRDPAAKTYWRRGDVDGILGQGFSASTLLMLWAALFFAMEGCPGHCRGFHRILSLYTLGVCSTAFPGPDNSNYLEILSNVPRGQNQPPTPLRKAAVRDSNVRDQGNSTTPSDSWSLNIYSEPTQGKPRWIRLLVLPWPPRGEEDSS